jgi:glycosyltransferase involved in cell wall biosynthesis
MCERRELGTKDDDDVLQRNLSEPGCGLIKYQSDLVAKVGAFTNAAWRERCSGVHVLRVLHITPAIFGEEGIFGGGERYAFELARHMAEKVETVLVGFGPRQRRERVGNLEIRVIGNPWYVRGCRGNPVALSLIAHLRRADVVHCYQQHVLATSMAAIVCRALRRRVFVTDLGGGAWDVSAYVSTDNWFDGHLHLSEYSRKVFDHEGKAFAHVILGGVDCEKFSPRTVAESKGAVVYAGRVLPHKGINDLVTAMAPEMELKIIGRVADRRFLTDLHRLAVGKRVRFEHNLDDAQLIEAYRGALCVVLPSVHRTIYGEETRVPELLGQTLIEGMACGCPAICTRVASLPEIVEDGVSGFIVPPNDPQALGDRIGWLREHPIEAAAMGVAARQRVIEKFTWPRVVRRCLEIYASTTDV